MSDAGTYTLVFAVPEPVTIEVGALGTHEFPAGGYAYTGSALGPGGFSRIDRHRSVAAGDHDVRHWHVDYLGGHPAVSLVDTLRVGSGRDAECRVARTLDAGPVQGFGASDCDCPSHLAHYGSVEAATAAVTAAYEGLPSSPCECGRSAIAVIRTEGRCVFAPGRELGGMFPPLAYLEWIEGRPTAAEHDLGSSDLRRLPDGDPDDPVPPRLAGLEPPDSDVSLAARVAAEYDVDESNVLLTAGATHAGFLAAATAGALARERVPSDDDTATAADPTADPAPQPVALVEKPGYEPLVETPRGLGMRVARFRRPDPNASLEPDRIEAAAADLPQSLAHVTVTNRHNPTGRLTTRSTLADAAAVVDDADGFLLVDEVYAPYTRDDGAGAFGGPTAAGLPSAVAVGSLTKFHGLGGLRVGWVVGPKKFVDRARSVRDHVPALAQPSVALARRFFAHRDELVADARDHCRANAELLSSFVDERDDLTGSVDLGSPFAYLEHDRVGGDAVSEAAWEAGVLVVPGRFFGLDDGVRVSLGRAPDDCADALAAFGTVLDDL